MSKRSFTLVLLLVGPLAATRSRAQGLTYHPSAATEILYNDAVDLLFREENQPAPAETAEGLGINVDGALVLEARPLDWLSLRLRPEVFAQIFFNRSDALVARLSPPLFISVRAGDRLVLLVANEYVANLVPRISGFTFQRDSATARLTWSALDALKLAAEYGFRVKSYAGEPDRDFLAHRFVGTTTVDLGAYVRVSGGYGLQLNQGSTVLGPGLISSNPDGHQHILSATARLAYSEHILEGTYQLRLARGGDPAASTDQPLLSASGALEEDIDELSTGGFDKHTGELTYGVGLPWQLTLNLYGRYSQKAFVRVTATSDPSALRVDNLWLAGLSGVMKLNDQLALEARTLYRVNDSNDAAYSFRNFIVALGIRWER